MNAVKNSNLDIGARTIEFNRAEYLIRALGYVKSVEDIDYYLKQPLLMSLPTLAREMKEENPPRR